VSADRRRGAAVIAAQLVEREEARLAAEIAMKQASICCCTCIRMNPAQTVCWPQQPAQSILHSAYLPMPVRQQNQQQQLCMIFISCLALNSLTRL
jgi:hypothetical protein